MARLFHLNCDATLWLLFMPNLNLPLHHALSGHTRLALRSSPSIQVEIWECAWLIAMGVLAATAATYFDWSLRIPGHAILRIVFPTSLGLAVVPRRGAGVVMGAAAASCVGVFSICKLAVPGAGAMTSLLLVGPLLDVALWRARSAWSIYGACGAAGLVANLVAFATRLVSGGGSGKPGWSALAPFTYVLCGLLAGVFCAAIWFSSRPRKPSGEGAHERGRAE